jgi:hypothetical protein
MMLLVAGALLAYAGLGAAMLLWPTQAQLREAMLPVVAQNLVLVPVACAWIAAEIIARVRRPRLLCAPVRAPVRRLLLGLTAGGLGVGLGAGVLPFVDRWAGDALVMGAAAAISAGGVVLLQRRLRPCTCITCGYDLREAAAPGRAGFGVCPECGTSVL